MPWVDLSESQLWNYRITTAEPEDLDQWWSQRLELARSLAKPVALSQVLEETYGDLRVYDVEFSGAGGERIRGWYLRPGAPDGRRLPVVVTFPGFGRGRGLPMEHALLPAVGFGHFVMDVRDQGPGAGDPGIAVRDITDPDAYYFTRLFVDAARAIDIVPELPGADPDLIAVSGGSQGGGLALAAAALAGDRVRICHAEVPVLCDIRRAVSISPRAPYRTIATFLGRHPELEPAAWETLSRIDCALLARRITANCLLAVGLLDDSSPPSTVYAVYHELRAPKKFAVAVLGDHRVPPDHTERKLRHLHENLR